MCPVQYLCIQYAKPWLHSDIRSCCCRSLHAFTSGYNSTLLGHSTSLFTLKVFLHEMNFYIIIMYVAKRKPCALIQLLFSTLKQLQLVMNSNSKMFQLCVDTYEVTVLHVYGQPANKLAISSCSQLAIILHDS